MRKKEKEVDRAEFVDLIRTQIRLAIKSIEQTNVIINNFQELYNDINRDQKTYNLKYYIVGDGLKYKRAGKKRIGF